MNQKSKKGKDSVVQDREKAKRIQAFAAKLKKNPGGLDSSPILHKSVFEGKTLDEKLKIIATVGIYGTHTWYLTRVWFPDESMWDGDWNDGDGVGLKCRSHWADIYGNVAHPDAEKIIADIRQCSEGALAAAMAVGFFVNWGLAEATFKAELIRCLISKGIGWADQLSIWVSSEEGHGNWHWCA